MSRAKAEPARSTPHPNAPFSEVAMKHTPGPWNAYPSPRHMPALQTPVICVMGDVDVAYIANHAMLESEEIQANPHCAKRYEIGRAHV